MVYLVVYDVKDHKRRAKICNLLKQHGYHLQYSAFLLLGVSSHELRKLYHTIKLIMDQRVDKVTFYPVEKMEYWEGEPVSPWNLYVI